MLMARRQAKFKRDTQSLETNCEREKSRANTLHLQWRFICHDLGQKEEKKQHRSWVEEQSLSERNIRKIYLVSQLLYLRRSLDNFPSIC